MPATLAARARARCRAWLIVGAVCLAGPALVAGEAAAKGAAAPAAIEVQGQVLSLNGYGERSKLWTKLYGCALYLPSRATRLPDIMDRGIAKALRLQILYPDPPEAMPKSLRRVFVRHLAPADLARLTRDYAGLESQDVVLFTYAPSTGSDILINGRRVLAVPGHALIADLLTYWLGAKPVSKELRAALLAGATASR